MSWRSPRGHGRQPASKPLGSAARRWPPRPLDKPDGWNEIFMHIVTVVIFGLVSLGVFVAAARLVGRRAADGARVFVWVWLAGSIGNGAVGGLLSGLPPVDRMAGVVATFCLSGAAPWDVLRL